MVTKPTAIRHWLYIAEWMKERGLSDEKLAEKLGLARETVTRYRDQQHRLNTPKIARLAAALDLEPEQLWRPPNPNRPSLDAMLRDAPDELVQDAAAQAAILLRSGGRR